MRAMQGENDKLVTKSAFMLRNMLVLNPSHKCKYQFIEIIFRILYSQTWSYVALVSALNCVSCKSLSLICMKINLQMKHSFITRVSHRLVLTQAKTTQKWPIEYLISLKLCLTNVNMAFVKQ